MWNRMIISMTALVIAFWAGNALAKKKEDQAPEKDKKAVVKEETAQPAPWRCCRCQANCPWQTAAKPAAAKPEKAAKTEENDDDGSDAKAPAVAPGRGRGAGFGPGRGRGMGPGRGVGGPPAGRGPMPEVMNTFHRLLDEHEKIVRTVKDIDGGIVTVTTSTDPEVTQLIRKHVEQMKELLEAKRPIRVWDPLFVKIFENADKIEMKIEEIKGGVKVTETSEDEEVVKLIRQHAKRGVSEFVKRGWDRAPEETPLPK